MKTYTIVFRPRARRDLAALDRYLSTRFGGNDTERFMRRLEAACLSLAKAPQRGRELHSQIQGLRIVGFERRVSILFRIKDEVVEILRILYGGQEIQTSAEELPKENGG